MSASIAMPDLQCTSRNGVASVFSCRRHLQSFSGPNHWRFWVTAIPPPAHGDSFQLDVVETQTGSVRIVLAENYKRPEYSAMGIPDALIPAVAASLGVDVESSPSVGAPGVFRTPAATNYWERLRKRGMATYDTGTDIYTFNHVPTTSVSQAPLPRFFHASIRPLPLHLMAAPPAATVCPNAVAAIEAARPAGLPSRAACYFGCEKPENAVRFLEAELLFKGQPPGQQIFLYEVEFPSGYHKGSMALIGAIEAKLKAATPADRAIAENLHGCIFKL